MDNDYEMRMDVRHSADVYQEMRTKVSARLVAASTMLQLSSMALDETITQELADNPALEAETVRSCDVCGTPLLGSICPTCLRMQKTDGFLEGDDWHSDPGLTVGRGDGDESFDPLSVAAGRETLVERLLKDLGAILPEEDHPIAEQIVGNLDDRGYLTTSVWEIADILDVEQARVTKVLKIVQTLDPVGLGARDLRECLLIQLDHLESQGKGCPIARELVAAHLDSLATVKLDRVARKLHTIVERIEHALSFIRTQLTPFPAQGYDGPDAIAEARASYLWPDVVIIQTDGRFAVEVIEAKRLDLRIASTYGNLARQAGELGETEREHVKTYVTRAKLFIQNINQRRHTIKKITEAIVAAQTDFLLHGIRHLAPLTRSRIAIEAGVDESTVSRATNGKNVLLPNGQVISYDIFFKPALSIHDVMREILATSEGRMTDTTLMDALAERGINIARRTVAKYRGQLGIPRTRRPSQLVSAA